MTHLMESHICLHCLLDCPFYRTPVLYFINEEKVERTMKNADALPRLKQLTFETCANCSEAPSQNPPATRPCLKEAAKCKNPHYLLLT